MVPSGDSKCAWCELELDTAARDSIRLSNTQPPWELRYRPYGHGAVAHFAAAGAAFSAAIRAARGADLEPVIELWFHRKCWRHFLELLNVDRSVA